MNIKEFIMLGLILSGIMTLLLSLYAYRKVQIAGTVFYMLLMVSGTIYSFGYAFELYNTTLEGIYFALKIEYLGIAPMAVCWFIMAFQYRGFGEKLTSFIYALLFTIPLITVIMLYSNEYHHLHYASLALDTTGLFPMAAITKGVWYHIDFVYKNILIFGGNILFFRMMFKTKGPLRRQAATMFFTSLLPWVGMTFYAAGIGPKGVDINPFF